jgi:hypothetical protein
VQHKGPGEALRGTLVIAYGVRARAFRLFDPTYIRELASKMLIQAAMADVTAQRRRELSDSILERECASLSLEFRPGALVPSG